MTQVTEKSPEQLATEAYIAVIEAYRAQPDINDSRLHTSFMDVLAELRRWSNPT